MDKRDDHNKPCVYSWKEGAEGISLPTLSAQESLLLMMARALAGLGCAVLCVESVVSGLLAVSEPPSEC